DLPCCPDGCPHIPLPVRRRVLRGSASRLFASSVAVATNETLGSLLLPLRGLTCRRCRIPFMVRTTGLHSFRRRILRFTTPGRPGAAAACYVALWRLPRPDFHRFSHQNLSRRTIALLGRSCDSRRGVWRMRYGCHRL